MKKIEKLKIHGREFKVVYLESDEMRDKWVGEGFKSDEGTVLNGACYTDQNLITVNKRVTSAEQLRDTLYHEAMHALLDIHFGDLIDLFDVSTEAVVRIMTAIPEEQNKVYKQIYGKS